MRLFLIENVTNQYVLKNCHTKTSNAQKAQKWKSRLTRRMAFKNNFFFQISSLSSSLDCSMELAKPSKFRHTFGSVRSKSGYEAVKVCKTNFPQIDPFREFLGMSSLWWLYDPCSLMHQYDYCCIFLFIVVMSVLKLTKWVIFVLNWNSASF